MTTMHPLQASPAYAEEKFRFLTTHGFRLADVWVSGGNSSRDGWRLTYSSPAVSVALSYLDQQLELMFTMADTAAEYRLLDHRLFARRSGWHGNMFPPQKLADAIDHLAADIQNNYGQVLSGDPDVWARIKKALETPTERPGVP